MNKIYTILTGTIGVGASEVAQILFYGYDLSEVTKLLTQLIILVATIYALFKKKKKINNYKPLKKI